MNYEQYHQKGGFYAIPVEIFDGLCEEKNELQKENQKLKYELEQCMAVADTNIELAESYHKEIERLKSLLKYDYEDGQTIMAELTSEKQELIDYLKEKENKLQKKVVYYEKQLKGTERNSFYYSSYLNNIHKLNAQRELIKEILSKIEKSDE